MSKEASNSGIPKWSVESVDLGRNNLDELEKNPTYNALSQSEKEYVKKTIETYYQVFTLLDGYSYYFSSEFVINDREKFLLEASASLEFGETDLDKKLQTGIVARILTGRIMKERYQRSKPNSAYFDFLSPQNPVLRALGEMWTDIYLQKLSQRDNKDGVIYETKKTRWNTLIDLDQHFSALASVSDFSSMKVKIPINHPGTDLKIKYKRWEHVSLEQRYQTEEVRQNLLANKDKIKPGLYYEGFVEDQILVIRATRTGYREQGRVEIDILNLQTDQLIHLSLDQNEFARFLKGGSVKVSLMEQWSKTPQKKGTFVKDSFDSKTINKKDLTRVRPIKQSDEVDDSSLDLLDDTSIEVDEEDKAMISKNPGGIDLNPAYLNLEIKRDGKGIPLPINLQPIKDMHIDGFVPIIINVTPVHDIPLLLGIAQPQDHPEVSLAK